MKLIVKTVTGSSFDVEVEPTDKVADVKSKIHETQGDAFRRESLVVIHKGKVLKDPENLSDAGVSDESFVVVMVSKVQAKSETPKPVPAGETSTQVSTPAEAPQAPVPPTTTNDTGAMETDDAAQEPANANATPGAAPEMQYGQAASNFATGSALQQSISQIVEMGFPREQVEQAMQTAFNNPDRAVEYLMNGIPEVPQQPSAPQANPQQPSMPTGPNTQPLDMFGGGTAGGAPAATGTPGAAAPGVGGAVGGAAVGAAGEGPLDFLRNTPQFHALRQMVAQNPSILQPMLHELGKTNPELFRQINEHQQDFLRLLTEEQSGEVAEAAQGLMQLGVVPAPVEDIEVSPEDEAAIGRLEALGFDRALCIEAFLICDKNEVLAANYLLENGED